LNREAHPAKPVRCHTVRIDAGSLRTIEDYATNYLAYQHVDLLVLNITLAGVASLFQDAPEKSEDEIAPRMRAEMVKFNRELTRNKTQLLLHWTNFADEVSDSENMYEREIVPTKRNLPGDLYARNVRVLERSVIPTLDTIPIRQYNARADFLEYEKRPVAPPLFGTDDSHWNPRGSAFVADGLANYLIRTGLAPER
jgi:hypothetical protein